MSKGNGIDATGLVKYDAMQRAIVAAVSVDEIKDIRDKAIALEKYAQLSRNEEAERRCAQIRIQAMTKGGQLAKQIRKEQGGPTKGTKRAGKGGKVISESNGTIKKGLGLTPDESSTWQQLAQAPEKVEAYLANEPDVPTTAGALAAVNPVKRKKAHVDPPLPFSDEALWLCGRIGDIDRKSIEPRRIADGCDLRMRKDLARHLDGILPILQTLREIL